MKKLAALLSTVCILACFLVVPAYTLDSRENIEITPYYFYTVSVTSTLTISNGTATCVSELSGGSSVAKIEGTQYLQKKDNSGGWSTINSGTWYSTVNSSYMMMINTKSNLDNGTYRVKSVFTVYGKDGGSETVEKISTEVTK